MIVAIVILSFLLVGAVAFIFWLLQVLKNTFEVIEQAMDMAQGKTPTKFKTAYDGKYYPATVISQVKFNCDKEMVITDFSMYEDKKIVGFTVCTKETIQEYIGAAADDFDDDILKETFGSPTIFKNVVVYSPVEGMWTWKSAE
jgi:hypothetical protein